MKALVLILLCLSGCTSITPIYGADGRVFYDIDCRRDEMQCLKAAGKTCGAKGYRFLSYKDQGMMNYSGELMVQCRD